MFSGNYIQQVGYNFSLSSGPGLIRIDMYLYDAGNGLTPYKLFYDNTFGIQRGMKNYTIGTQIPNSNGYVLPRILLGFQLLNSSSSSILFRGANCPGCEQTFPQAFGPPPTSIPGNHVFGSGNFRDYNSFVVSDNNAFLPPTGPTITINPQTGTINSNAILSGQGFHSFSLLNFTFNNQTLVLSAPNTSVRTTTAGKFNNTNFAVPISSIGNNPVRVCDASNSCANALFNTIGATITNFASGIQNNNSTIVSPLITSNTNVLVLNQALYTSDKTIQQILSFSSPISINNLNHQVALPAFNTINITSQTTFYENVTLTDGSNLYTIQSQSITFTPVLVNRSPNPVTQPTTTLTPGTNNTNPGNQILTNQTYQPANITPGQQNFLATNTNTIPILYNRMDHGPLATYLLVSYPNSFNLTCNLSYQFAQVNKTYNNIPHTNLANNRFQSNFTFINPNNEIITTNCTDVKTHVSGLYILTQTNFPLQQQVKQFRSGQFGTHGQFGVIDIISLIGILAAMIGLSRVNEAAGIIIAVILLTILSFFQIVTWQTTITGLIATIVMIAIVSTKKLPWSQ